MRAPDAEDDLALLTRTALAAGEIARRHFGKGPQIWQKEGGQGPVTEADLEIDAMLRRDLLAARPDHGWLSEESADTPERLTRARVFVIDPIDGTRAFIDGQRSFSHSLAIVEHGVPVTAAIYLPMLERLYLAARGQGTTCNGVPVFTTGRTELEAATMLATKPNVADVLWKGGFPPVERHFRPSLAYRLALVAEGRFDAMVTLRPAWEWDIAAGALLVSEAGGRVADRRGATLAFNNPHPMLDGVVAGTEFVARALLNRIV